LSDPTIMVMKMFKTKIRTKDGLEILLREPKASDLKEFLRHINKQVEDRTEGLGINKKKTLKEEREWLKSVLHDVRTKKKVFLVFEHNGKIAGSCEVRRKEGLSDHIAMFGVGMEKEYRRQGIGTQVLPILFKLAKKRMKGLRIIALDVYSFNKPAQGLYKKVGFRKVATIPDGAMLKGKLYDQYLMYYYLRR
ncbi:MAG: GNAT family protein, partial [Candidatus Aenigmatarchaeota archaeon]